MTLDKIKKYVDLGVLIEHHTSYCKRYVSRKIDGIVEAYSGRFGNGYKVYQPNWQSTQYSFVTYYIFE